MFSLQFFNIIYIDYQYTIYCNFSILIFINCTTTKINRVTNSYTHTFNTRLRF